MTAVIEVSGLRKEYRHVRRPATIAVDGLDLSVPEGGVFGFLGPNGSGKTTTIRCLLGLAAPSAGSCRLLGVDTPRSLASVIGKVGAIVETPTLYPAFSGRRNLSLLGGLYGIPKQRTDDVLERVGLGDRANDRVKTYSLGMRQRLGLAAALLKDPALLILDEPANGLDPAGMVEIRQLLRSLADEGRTVFVSSHLLAEIEQTCDHVAILTRGRLVTSGLVKDVISAGGGSRVTVKLDQTDQIAAAMAALASGGFEAHRDIDALVVTADPSRSSHINQLLGSQGIWVRELRPDSVTLEDVFLQLTGEPSATSGMGSMGAPPGPYASAPPQPSAPSGEQGR
jgi:ABC-2 type transport system ATP-binding protein